jgi:hypothetical protein
VGVAGDAEEAELCGERLVGRREKGEERRRRDVRRGKERRKTEREQRGRKRVEAGGRRVIASQDRSM